MDSHQFLSSPNGSTAVLISGGLDSAILLAESLRHDESVYPLYVRGGLFYESAELTHLSRYLEAVQSPALNPLHILELPLQDLYARHWSVTGRNVPSATSPDEAVFLPGRNVLLLSKALVWCQLRDVPLLSMALLKNNPFPDATPQFRAAYAKIVSDAIGGNIRVIGPFDQLAKREVMRLGRDLPLELTFSCIRPVDDRHCGSCNKCAERRHAFADAGMVDRTNYVSLAGV
jgi:7-cyano-7-deazaguanine synthase